MMPQYNQNAANIFGAASLGGGIYGALAGGGGGGVVVGGGGGVAGSEGVLG